MTDLGSGPLSTRGIERTDLKFDLQLESLARKKKKPDYNRGSEALVNKAEVFFISPEVKILCARDVNSSLDYLQVLHCRLQSLKKVEYFPECSHQT